MCWDTKSKGCATVLKKVLKYCDRRCGTIITSPLQAKMKYLYRLISRFSLLYISPDFHLLYSNFNMLQHLSCWSILGVLMVFLSTKFGKSQGWAIALLLFPLLVFSKRSTRSDSLYCFFPKERQGAIRSFTLYQKSVQ